MSKKDKNREQGRESYDGFGALGKLFDIQPPPEEEKPKKTFTYKPSPKYQSNRQNVKNYNNGNQGSRRNFDNQPQSTTDKRATAPYNFVSLPDKALPSPMENNHKQLLSDKDSEVRKSFREYIEETEQINGEIQLEIEALTPLFIGGNPLDKRRSFTTVDENFPILPGSSLRGMFKNIFKIVTCGTMRGRTKTQQKGEDLTDEHIYFRCLMASRNSPAWMDDLNKLYNGRMIGTVRGKDGKPRPAKNARPGFLIKDKKGNYFIAPSIYQHDRTDDRILIKEYERKFREHIEIRNDSRVTWQDRVAYIITGSQPEYKLHDEKSYRNIRTEDKKKQGKQFIRFTKIDYVDWSREHWIKLPEDVRESYEHDRNRRGVNLFKDRGILKRDKLKELVKNLPADVESLVPCHFLEEDGEVTAFGHGQCFRIPYKKRIADAIPKSVNSDIIDFADAVFGRKSFWASRVFFEDGKPEGRVEVQETATAHPQMQPNPTSYQLYLKQQPNQKLNHWDSDRAQIRGYKLYWHNGDPDWKATDSELSLDAGKSEDKRLTRDLTPLNRGNKFVSKIRFSNLSKIELGALLMIFDLNGEGNEAAYKLGQGKAFGLGSIKVNPTLYVEDEDAYTDVFDERGWRNPYRVEAMTEYLNAFKSYIQACGMQTTWENVIKELNMMLSWKNTEKEKWSDRVKSMSGDVQSGNVDERFKSRIPLPNIFEVVK